MIHFAWVDIALFVVGVLAGALFVWAVFVEQEVRSTMNWTIGEDDE